MTKAEIIDAVYELVGGFSKKEAAELVEAVFDEMKDCLARGEKIKISGFGNFVVRYKRERVGRNPQTGEPIPISARRVLTFKPSQVLKGVLNPHKADGRSELGDDAGDGAGSATGAATAAGVHRANGASPRHHHPPRPGSPTAEPPRGSFSSSSSSSAANSSSSSSSSSSSGLREASAASAADGAASDRPGR
jgi:integration host factor subunit alpha